MQGDLTGGNGNQNGHGKDQDAPVDAIAADDLQQ